MTVRTETVDRIRIISLNRPDRHNALDDPTMEELPAAVAAAAADDAIDVILLRGEGRSFCSGRDMAVLDAGESGAEHTDESHYEYIRRHQERRLAQLECPKPIVAAVKGYAIGGGMEIALATDIRVAASDLRMSLPEARYGICADTGGTVLTTILAGPSRAKLLLLTGRKIDAQTALAWGLVDLVVEPDELDSVALDLCREIAANNRTAVRISKQLVDQTWEGTVRRGMRTELLAQTALIGSPEFTSLADQRAEK